MSKTTAKRLDVGTKVIIATPQGSQFDGESGVITKHLDGDAYVVHLDKASPLDLMFSHNEVKVAR